MEELTKAQKGRLAIRSFKTIADALALRGYYKPSGKSGQTLEDALKSISPEIYGTINDPRSIEIRGLQYVLERLPRGIEECSRITLTAQDDFDQTSFEKIEPPKRRRIAYRISSNEICFVITRGLSSEMYDLLTHLTFLNIEANKIYNQIKDLSGDITVEWRELEKNVISGSVLKGKRLDKAIWNLSIILGRTYYETRKTYEYLEKSKEEKKSNAGLFQIIYQLGKRVESGKLSRDNELLIYFTPSFRDMMGHHKHSRSWAQAIKDKLSELGFEKRPLHIISANMHSLVNLLYAYSAMGKNIAGENIGDLYSFINQIRGKEEKIISYAVKHGLLELPDSSGAHIDCQIIDASRLESLKLHPELSVNKAALKKNKPVLLVMDYAFGTQAFEVMDELLNSGFESRSTQIENVQSISIMGKAGILPGKKGDIILATAHVLEGIPHNYLINNDLEKKDFDDSANVYTGPVVTVLGTSLQNRDVLEKFHTASWKAVGLEMEGGHYQRAINAAIIRGHISKKVKIRYAYYASDNPLYSGETLASGSMGTEGIRPTYMITKVILEKILNVKDKFPDK
ncbi:MAG: hypothetical protein JJV91_00705 [Desulfosarcina sp.]|nr:hypothetical protein [Desulfobacterales bacterium]